MIKDMTKIGVDAYYKGAQDALRLIHKALEMNFTAYKAYKIVLESFEKARREHEQK